jgi:uncharacterized protein
MVTDTGEHPRRDPIPPDWPGDDPTLPEELTALGHRRALPVRPAARHRRIYREPDPAADDAPPDGPHDAPVDGPIDGDDRDVVDVLPVETGGVGDVLDAVEAGRIADGDDDRHEAHVAHAGAEPDDDLVAGVQPAGRVLVVMVLALVLAMLVNADALVARAEQKSPGPGRDRSLAVWHAVQDVSHALQLHRIREVADRLAGDDGDDDAATTGASPDPSTDAAGDAGGDADADADADARVTPSLDGDSEGDGNGDADADADAGGVPRLRTPTAGEPLRLWVGGDSMAQVFGPALAERASATGLVYATVHYEMASGLTRPDYFDWPRALAADVEEVDPEVVVVVFGVNDAQGIVQPDGTPVPEVGDPRWAPEYRRRVGALMDQLRHEGRLVVWVALPPMREPGYDGRMTVIDGAVAAEAATRPWIVLVDSTSAVAAGGAFADAVPDAAGTPVDVRQDDGIHLTTAGGERLAGHVFDALAGRVDLTGSGGDDGGRA